MNIDHFHKLTNKSSILEEELHRLKIALTATNINLYRINNEKVSYNENRKFLQDYLINVPRRLTGDEIEEVMEYVEVMTEAEINLELIRGK